MVVRNKEMTHMTGEVGAQARISSQDGIHFLMVPAYGGGKRVCVYIGLSMVRVLTTISWLRKDWCCGIGEVKEE